MNGGNGDCVEAGAREQTELMDKIHGFNLWTKKNKQNPLNLDLAGSLVSYRLSSFDKSVHAYTSGHMCVFCFRIQCVHLCC